MASVLQDKNRLQNALKAFNMVRDLSESEIETLEILSDPDQEAVILNSLEESKKGKVHSVKSIL